MKIHKKTFVLFLWKIMISSSWPNRFLELDYLRIVHFPSWDGRDRSILNEKTPDQLIQLFRRCMFVARFRHKFEAKQHAQPFGHHSFICCLMCLIQLMDLDSVPQAILRNGKIFTLTSKPKSKKFKKLFWKV